MQTLTELFGQALADHGDLPCVLHKAKEGLASQSYAELGEMVRDAACGLCAAGVEPGERVVIVAENCPEWVVADLGLLHNGAADVPLYPSLPAEQIQPLIARVRAKRVIVGDHHQLAKLDQVRDRLPSVEEVFVFDADKVPADHPVAKPWSALVQAGNAGRGVLLPEVERRAAAVTPDDLATIIFTSGTTGEPKGAMLTHGNFTSNVLAGQAYLHLRAGDTFVSFLPLCHVFQRMVTYLGLHAGVAAMFNESLRALLGNLVLVRPTVLIVVPRLLETMRSRVQDGIRAKTGLQGTIAHWAMEVADQVGKAYAAGRPLSGWQRLQQRMAEQRVFSAIREQLGLDQIRFMVSGGAALPPELGRWYYGIGIMVCQGYGLTETSPLIAVNDPEAGIQFDTIGRPAPGIEVKIAEDGELLSRGPHIMKGYFEMPEATAEAIDAEAWFHTGDIGEWTPDGHLKITDRKKNIMVLANGKNVAPVPIESRLSESPLIDRIMLIGDNQNVVTALVVPAFDLLKDALAAQGEAVEDGPERPWLRLPAAEKLIRAEIERLSTELAGFEQVRRFRLLDRDFSLDQGEMTPTMKLRRKQILTNYADLVRDMAE